MTKQLTITKVGPAVYFNGDFCFGDLSYAYSYVCNELSVTPEAYVDFSGIKNFNTALVVLLCELIQLAKLNPRFHWIHLPLRVSMLAKLYGLDLLLADV